MKIPSPLQRPMKNNRISTFPSITRPGVEKSLPRRAESRRRRYDTTTTAFSTSAAGPDSPRPCEFALRTSSSPTNSRGATSKTSLRIVSVSCSSPELFSAHLRSSDRTQWHRHLLLPPELLRNYLTTTRGREFLNQYGEEQRAPDLGPYGMLGGQDLRQHLQQIRGQPQGVPPPPPPHYVAAPPPPHGAPPHGHLAGGAQIFYAFGIIVSPLSEDILNTPMPYGYKVPNIKPYNGIGNPNNFLSQFKYNMLNQNLGSVHMCKLFPEQLIDNAREWFDSLPAESIRSYADLMNAFSRSFSQRVEVRHTPAHLLTVKQD